MSGPLGAGARRFPMSAADDFVDHVKLAMALAVQNGAPTGAWITNEFVVDLKDVGNDDLVRIVVSALRAAADREFDIGEAVVAKLNSLAARPR